MQGSGIPDVDMAAATIEMNDDGSFNLAVGATDLGTGSDTILGQIAAEVLGVPLVKIIDYVVVADCGMPIKPAAAEGQLEGAVANGVGYALTRRCSSATADGSVTRRSSTTRSRRHPISRGSRRSWSIRTNPPGRWAPSRSPNRNQRTHAHDRERQLRRCRGPPTYNAVHARTSVGCPLGRGRCVGRIAVLVSGFHSNPATGRLSSPAMVTLTRCEISSNEMVVASLPGPRPLSCIGSPRGCFRWAGMPEEWP